MAKTAIVTGATSDIGIATAQHLARDGYDLVLHCRNRDLISDLEKELSAQGTTVKVAVADLREPGAVSKIFEVVQSMPGELKVLVNNAGGVVEDDFEVGKYVDPSETFQINFFASYEACQRAASIMSKDSVIINVSSINAVASIGPDIPLYDSAKAAVAHLSKQLAINYAPNIRVNSVSPGRTWTAAWKKYVPNEERKTKLANDQLIERWITPDEIAEAIMFLIDNGAVTGTDLIIDGGLALKLGAE